MLYSKSGNLVVSAITGCALAAYGAGESLHQYSGPAPGTLLSIAAATSTSSVSMMTFNATTFAQIEAPPPVIPARLKMDQG